MNIIIPATFDTFHEGHERLLDFASAINGGKKITIIVNGDELCKRNGKKIRDNIDVRVANIRKYVSTEGILAEMRIIEDGKESVEIAKDKSPCFWLTGRDWDIYTTSKRNKVPPTFWEENDIYLLYKDRVPHVSSTKIRNKGK